MKKAVRNIEYYMELPYRIEIVNIPADKGGGFMARLPQLGRMAAIGDGETIEEAIRNLEESKRSLFEECIAEGVEIPDPDTFEDDFSGRFVLRIPKYLHKDLAHRARENRVSLNAFSSALLAQALYKQKTSSALQNLHNEIKNLRNDICKLSYRMTPSSITLRGIKFEADNDYDANVA